MDIPQGTIVALVDGDGGPHADIEVEVAAACPRCARGRGCGAGIFGAGGRTRQIRVPIDKSQQLETGDRVRLCLAADNVLRAAILVYGVPLLGALIGVIGSYALALGDAGTALAAIAGLTAGALASRRRLRRESCLRRFTPSIRRLT